MQPQAGHAVRTTGPTWWSEEAGRIGIIGGTVGKDIQSPDETLVIFRFSAFRGRNTGFSSESSPEYVSVSGGPGLFIPPSALKATGETVTVTFWRWKDLPRADGGENYQLEVPVWDWDPPESQR